jgi:hypothetical protein
MKYMPGPGVIPTGALAIQVTADSATTPVHAPVDSVAAHPSFSDPVVTAVQFFFQQSPVVMWGGVIVAAILAALLGRFAWARRARLANWLRTRTVLSRAALVGGLVLLVVATAALGYRAKTFVETDNRFCNGCHIFVASGEPWIPSDTGNYTLVNRMEGKHDTLSCHACHELKPVKEAVKMVWWMSGVREEEIPPHARVPRQVCENCHVQGDARELWQEIAATAGHRVHLESDSSALSQVECLTCHVQEVHRFIPVNTSCTQKGCHENTTIALGDMAQKTVALEAHCTACHEFTAEVPKLATRDSAAGTLVPGDQQCTACHQMQARLGSFDPARDPHGGTCGMCHDPHAQSEVQEAKLSCTTASCHDTWRSEPFHLGANHRRVANQCTTCHVPHQAKVDASDCSGCHQLVRARSNGQRQPPLPFDTTAAKRRASVEPARELRGKGDSPPGPEPGAPVLVPTSLAADTFSHTTHQQLSCITCHTTRAGQGGALTFERPRGCQICHHQAPSSNNCAACHQSSQLTPGRPMSIAIAVMAHPPRPRTVSFEHRKHERLRCSTCHTTAVSLRPDSTVVTCAGCHVDHHESSRACAGCHVTDQIVPAHRPPVDAHQNCGACHTPGRVAELTPTRSLCLTCHTGQDHFSRKQCTACHFQASPEVFQAHLRQPVVSR